MAIRRINAFTSKGTVSSTMSPAMIVDNPDMKNKRISFGFHAMVFIGTDKTMKRSSAPAIALNPSNNHGGHYFMNLYTGKKLHSYHWQELPIDDETIDRVEELAMNDAQRRLTDNYPFFEWEPGMTIRDNVETQMNEEHENSMNHDGEETMFEEGNLDDDMPDDEIRNHDNKGEN